MPQAGQGGAAVTGRFGQGHAQPRGDTAQHLGRVLGWVEGQELATVVEVAGADAQQLLGQARLAHAAHAGDEHGAAVEHHALQRGQFGGAAGEGGQVIAAVVEALGEGGRAGRRRAAAQVVAQRGGDGGQETLALGRRHAQGARQAGQAVSLSDARLVFSA